MSPAGLRSQGVTLIELLTGIVVLGILLAVAAPGFQASVDQNAVVSEANRIITDIQYARSEAIKRSSPVNLCRSADVTTCTGPDCACHTGTVAKQYDEGWLMYVASGRDTSFNPDQDTLLRLGQPARSTITIRSDTDLNQWLSVSSTGALDENGFGLLAVCMNGESTVDVPGRLISIPLTGRPSISKIAPGGSCTP